MTNDIYNDVTKRHDFVLLFDVTDGNPNGDPDAGNLPRVDPETMNGLVTDVCLKRKVRNYVKVRSASEQDASRKEKLKIYVEHNGILNAQHKRAYTALKISCIEPVATGIDNKELIKLFTSEEASFPEGFSVREIENDASSSESKFEFCYSGELSKEDLKEALKIIGDTFGKEALKFAGDLTKSVKKASKPKREDIDRLRIWMCENFFDVRMFGAVMTTGVNCGQVRGPLQLTFARSIDSVVPLDLCVTRVAVTREEDAAKKETEMGRKALLPYGLYKGYGFFTPHFATDTGVASEDLALFWSALQNMWDIDHSASRGMMACRGLYIFSHNSELGNAPAHTLFDRVKVKRNDEGKSPRNFTDYKVSVDENNIPTGVTITKLVS